MAPKWPMEAWAVSVVATTAGPDVHLVEDRALHTDAEPRSLCGVNASLPTRTPFRAERLQTVLQSRVEGWPDHGH